jgi:hypothetical protein
MVADVAFADAQPALRGPRRGSSAPSSPSTVWVCIAFGTVLGNHSMVAVAVEAVWRQSFAAACLAVHSAFACDPHTEAAACHV